MVATDSDSKGALGCVAEQAAIIESFSGVATNFPDIGESGLFFTNLRTGVASSMVV